MAQLRRPGRLLWQLSSSRVLVKSSTVCDSTTNPLFFAAQGLRGKKTTTKVILTTNVDGLGRAGDIVAVAPGYFRNYLMPKLLAMPNLDKYAKVIKGQLKDLPQQEVIEQKEDLAVMEEKMKEYQRAANILSKTRLSLRRYIKVEKELQCPITKEEIIKEVARQLSVSIQPENLHLPAPITSLGEFEVPLRLPRQIPLPEGVYSWALQVKIRKR